MTTQVPRATVATLVSVAAIVAANLPATAQKTPVPTPVSSYHIVKIYPHDRRAFTQGLQYVNGVLYEGTGLNGQSTIRKVKLENGEVLQERETDPVTSAKASSSGRTAHPDHLAIRDRVHLRPRDLRAAEDVQLHRRRLGPDPRRHAADHERRLASLRFLDPETLRETGTDDRAATAAAPVKQLNELEYVKGEIFANVWQTDRIARISPKTGR